MDGSRAVLPGKSPRKSRSHFRNWGDGPIPLRNTGKAGRTCARPSLAHLVSLAVIAAGENMREPNVKDHPQRQIVLDALKAAQSQGESSPVAMARATRAIVEAHPEIMLGEAFNIVWTIWEA